MPELVVKVTQDVLAQIAAGNTFQSQIAVTEPTDHLVAQVAAASATNRFEIPVGGFIHLTLGDSGAFWRAHQTNPQAFDRLFHLLALYPGQGLRFRW